MNIKILVLSAMMGALGISYADTTPPVQNPSNKQTKKKKVSVPVYCTRPTQTARKPGLPIYVYCLVEEGTFRVETPAGIYIEYASLEQLTAPCGFWISTSSDDNGCNFDFDGTAGEYKLICTEGETVYVGNFTLD